MWHTVLQVPLIPLFSSVGVLRCFVRGRFLLPVHFCLCRSQNWGARLANSPPPNTIHSHYQAMSSRGSCRTSYILVVLRQKSSTRNTLSVTPPGQSQSSTPATLLSWTTIRPDQISSSRKGNGQSSVGVIYAPPPPPPLHLGLFLATTMIAIKFERCEQKGLGKA
jgi:hypothetical protein